MASWWRGLAPAMGGARPADAGRAALGAGLGLLLAGLGLQGAGLGWLIAPFGASAVLIHAVPNSPLAQPFSVVAGNTLSALVALAVMAVAPEAGWAVPLAVSLAIAAMVAARALHPPGGAVALLVEVGGATGPGGMAQTLATVAVGSCLLVAFGILWNRATGRAYPFRQPAQSGPHGTQDPTPETRIGLDPSDLAVILEDYRQSANLGVADLARLVGAAEQAAAARRMEGFVAADIMSRDLVTVPPDAPLAAVADIFRSRGFTSLPVVAEGDRLLGVIFQIGLIRRAREDAFHHDRGLLPALARLTGAARGDGWSSAGGGAPCAASIMQRDVARVAPDTPVGALLPLLADGGAEAVPVMAGPAIVGIVTRSDLVSALARRLAFAGSGGGDAD